MRTSLEAAIQYLHHGISVIPLRPGDKRPAVAWKEFQRRRPTEAEVRAWWSPSSSLGVAIACGRVSSVAVLDVDPRNGGDESLARFPSLSGPMAITGGGGRHFFMAINGEDVPKIPNLLPGVDLQGEGSYVVAPPSIHPNGTRYTWAEGRALGVVSLPSLPMWLRHLVRDWRTRRTPSYPGSGGSVSLNAVLPRLQGVRRAGNGWLALCPGHDDVEPSLSVGVGTDGKKVLLFCHAGCPYPKIIAALNEVTCPA